MNMSELKIPDFETFQADALARGADEVLLRDWTPNQVVEPHSHPFNADALVVAGEMWLMVGDDTQHLLAGDTFQLPAGTLHHEKYGPEGATYWVARSMPA